MSAVLEAREQSARYLEATQPTSAGFHDLLIAAPSAVPRLREFIRSLAVQGRLLPHAETRSSDLPANWTWKRLDDLVASSEAGWSPSCPEHPRREGRWGVLKVSAVSWGVFDPSANKELPADLDPRQQYEVMDGDFLLSRANTAELVARSVVVRNPPARLMLSDKIIRLRLREGVNADYVNLVNNGVAARSHYQAKASGTSTSMKNVSRDVVLALPVPLPPLAEQTRIVTRVDELMRLCDALEAKGRLEAEQHARLLDTLLGTLTDSTTPEELAANWQRVAAHFDLLLDRPEAVDALEQTILQLAGRGLLVPQATAKASFNVAATASEEGLFEAPQSWKWLRMEQVATVQGGIQKTPARKPVKHHVPYLRVANVQRDRLDLHEIERFEVAPDEAERWGLRVGDLLIVEGNGSEHEIGRSAVWAGAINPCVYQNHLIRVRCNEPAFVDFLQLFLNSPDGRAEMKRLAITTSGLYNLSVGKIRRFLVPLPPAEEQARIVTRVTELRRLCADLRARLAAQQAVQSHLADALVEQALA